MGPVLSYHCTMKNMLGGSAPTQVLQKGWVAEIGATFSRNPGSGAIDHGTVVPFGQSHTLVVVAMPLGFGYVVIAIPSEQPASAGGTASVAPHVCATGGLHTGPVATTHS